MMRITQIDDQLNFCLSGLFICIHTSVENLPFILGGKFSNSFLNFFSKNDFIQEDALKPDRGLKFTSKVKSNTFWMVHSKIGSSLPTE